MTARRKIHSLAVINRLSFSSQKSAETLEISHGNRVIHHVDHAADGAVRIHEGGWSAHNLDLLQVSEGRIDRMVWT